MLTAPLATSTGSSASAATISGARTLADKVSVTYHHPGKKTRTTDVHLLAFNDLHGNLEADGLNIYGQFAGGAAYLAKAIKDRQAQYRGHEATIFAGDNIGASPLANGLFFEEPTTIATNLMNVDFASVGNHEFDKGKDELLRIQNGGCKPDVGCTAAPYVDGRHDHEYLSGRRLPVPVGERHRRRHRPHAVPGVRHQAVPLRQWQEVRRRFHRRGPEGHADDRHPDGRRRAHVLRRGRRGEQSGEAVEAQGRQDVGARDPPGWVPDSAPAALNGCAGNLAGSDILKIAERLDPSIKVIVSAHTHAEYRCTITTTTAPPG